jgi:GAF domain-containing protein
MSRRRFKLSITGPILVGLIILLAFGTTMIVGPRASNTAAQQVLVSNNRAIASMVARLLFNPLSNLDIWTLQNTLDGLVEETNIVYATIRDASGRSVTEATATEEKWVPDEQASRQLATQALELQDIVQQETEGYLVLCNPIAVGEQIGTLELVFDQTPLRAAGEYVRKTMLPAFIALPIAAVLLVAILAHLVTSPFRALTAAAEGIGHGNLDSAVPIRGAKETALLGTALEHMRAELQELYLGLEQQVSSLERRAQYLEASAEVAQDAASVLDIQDLLSRVTMLISERLGFYHTGIFLLAPTGEWATLSASSSEGGRRMLARGHRLRVGRGRPQTSDGIVSYVISRREPYTALDVGADAVFFDNPDLPDTRSEMALPLRARGEIIGALDVQSIEPAAFSDEDMAVLQTLADQVAMAISNARLFRQAQENLEAVQRAYGELSREAWSDMLRGQPNLGYYCDDQGITPIAECPRMQSIRDIHKNGERPELSIPVTGQGGGAIGAVRAHKPSSAGEWTPEETALMKTLTDQLSVALESARLYQNTQHRAASERLIGEVTTRIRESLDVESVLTAAADEIYRALDLEEIVIRLATDEADIDHASADIDRASVDGGQTGE